MNITYFPQNIKPAFSGQDEIIRIGRQISSTIKKEFPYGFRTVMSRKVGNILLIESLGYFWDENGKEYIIGEIGEEQTGIMPKKIGQCSIAIDNNSANKTLLVIFYLKLIRIYSGIMFDKHLASEKINVLGSLE